MIKRKIGFSKKLQIGITLVIVVIIIVSGINIKMLISSRKDLVDIVEERVEKEYDSYDIEKNVIISKMMIGMINGNPSVSTAALETIKDNRVIIEERFTKLGNSTVNEEAKIIFAECVSSYEDYKDCENFILYNLSRNFEINNTTWARLDEVCNTFLKNIEKFIQYQEEKMDYAINNAKERYQYIYKVVILLMFTSAGLIGLIGYWIIRSTTKDLKQVTNVLEEIDLNNPSTLRKLDVNTKDEIGLIAEAFNHMSVSLGNYSKNEESYKNDIKIQNWVLSKIAEVASLTQRIFNINELAEHLLGKLAPFVDASVGAFYLKSEDEKTGFYRAASYGNGGREQFEIGDGIIGQVAVDQQLVLLEDIPEDYKLLSTGLGEVKPKSILIAPIIYENSTIAVIEFASMKNFSKMHYQGIRQVTESLGLAVHSVLNRMEVENLLNDSKAMTEELQVQTEELHAQSEELITINEMLEEQKREAEIKTLELQKSQEQLRVKNEELHKSSNYKSEFLANISHELRTPLNSILILTELLADTEIESFSIEEKEYIDFIHSAAESLTGLINDILDLSKIEAGKSEVLLSEVNVSEMVDTLTSIFSPQAEKKELKFTIEIDKDMPSHVYTDEQKMLQIIKNLISNSIKFTDQGSVTVKLEKVHEQDLCITNKNNDSDYWTKIVVKDTGIGIPIDKQQIIFEAFQQADGSTVRKYGGTGLGLSICKKLTQLLNGHISVESKEGEGSVFTVCFPTLLKEDSSSMNQVAAAKEPIEFDTSLENNESDILVGKRVLITDDDERNIYTLKKALEKRGIKIIVAHNGIECLEILKKDSRIDMILMDIMMPEMNGYEAMKNIRSDEQLASIPILALTAKVMKGDREKCMEAGASDYISKPINLEQLISVMRVWLT